MNKKIKYSDEPLNELNMVSDFLPTPLELSLRNRNTKITISLSTESINFFKDQARTHDMQYQKMIRQLLDDYVTQQKALTSSNRQTR
ncbi:MAG TPA: CopG family transcriptional regulator [Gammaproteobacteria bacterium]|jgi:predicted DNA binding CopG/RHH family protein|nr:CopG family transcriptional regulator [Gammaproteobacteria bacterium]